MRLKLSRTISRETAWVLFVVAAASGIPIGMTAGSIVQQITVEVGYPLTWSCSVSVNGQPANTYTGVGYTNNKFTFYNVQNLLASCTAIDTTYTYSICIQLLNYKGQSVDFPCVASYSSRTVTATWPP